MQPMKSLCWCLCLLSLPLGAQTNTAATAAPGAMPQRSLSLHDCIGLALQHNLDVQMLRHAPTIARYNLKAAYGVQYDPVFSFGAKREFAEVPPITDPKKASKALAPGLADRSGIDNPYSVTADVLEADLSGKLTPGLSYTLGGSSSELSGDARLLTPFSGPIPPNFTVNGVPYIVAGKVTYGYFFSQMGLSLKQSLLKNFWIDSARMQIQLNKKDLKISEQELRQQLMTTILAVQVAYYDLVFASENVKVMQKSLSLSQELFDADRRRVSVGTLPPLSESMSESLVETAKANLLGAEELMEAKRNALRNLLTDDATQAPDEILNPSETLTVVWGNPHRADSLQAAMKYRPEVIEARLQTEKQGIIVRYNYNQMFPSLDLVGSYGAMGVDDSSRSATFGAIGDSTFPTYSVGVLLQIPLSNTAARNRWHASKEARIQSLLNQKKIEQNVFFQVDDTLKALEKTYKRVGATRKAAEFAQAAYEAERKKLEGGTSTSFAVSQYDDRQVAARTAEIMAVVDFNKALAQLAFHEGTSLEKNQVKLDLQH